ncbi:hypothetical protein QBC41DRAFT_229113 [Cercophora samala]|uniref:Uncharacterized protein n=1 Tax=Cercophora samala TaxID=330535 RepID=A0AA39ZB36_9PEZI|nr:hypothetical protein QBC41DRAFT_229113 [Cercophora samala]
MTKQCLEVVTTGERICRAVSSVSDESQKIANSSIGAEALLPVPQSMSLTTLEANIIAYGAGVLWTTGGLKNRKQAHEMTWRVLKLREKHMESLSATEVNSNEHVLLANAYNDWALQLMNEGKYMDARAFSQRSLDIKERHLDTRTNQFEFFISKILLAVSELAEGLYVQSLVTARSAINHIVEEKGHEDPYTQHWMFHVANIVAGTGDFQKALELHRSALQARVALFGESSYAALDSYFSVGFCLYKVGDFMAASKSVAQCIGISESAEWASECLLRARYLEALILKELGGGNNGQQSESEINIIAERNQWLTEFGEDEWKTPGESCQEEFIYFDYLVNMHSGRTTVGQSPIVP